MKLTFKQFLLAEAKKSKKVKVTKSTAAKVYHRDYVKTKDKPYRSYDEQKDDGK